MSMKNAPAASLSLAIHLAAFAAAGYGTRSGPPAPADSPIEVVLENEPAPEPPPPEPSAEEPLPNRVAPTAPAPPTAPLARNVVAPSPAAPPPPPVEAPASPVVANDDPFARFAHFTIASRARPAIGQAMAQASSPASSGDGATDHGPYAEAAVDVPARAARKVRPRYPPQAQAGGIEATVQLEIALSKTGNIESVRALSHPGYGFEQEAIAAVRSTPFIPAMRRGFAVPVRMAWTVEFRLQ
jgi:protein TonB